MASNAKKKTAASNKNSAASERQNLIMWALLTHENAAAYQKDLKPEPEKADRDALERAGLIRWEKHKQGIRIEVTDTGWEWAGNNLSAPLPAKSNAGTAVLGALLARLSTFVMLKGIVLADVLDPQAGAPNEKAVAPPPSPENIRKRIRNAYLDTTRGRFNTRALLKDIRARLPEVDRKTLDETLRQMQQDEEAILYQLDSRVELTDADHEAAIHFAGEPRHILWIER